MNIEEAKKKLNNPRKETLISMLRRFKKEGVEHFVITRPEYIETVLNELEKLKEENADLQKSVKQIYDNYQDAGNKMFEYSEELEKKDKIIDLMAEYLDERTQSCPLEDEDYDMNCEDRCSTDQEITKECWIKYFGRKVEE